MAVIMRNTAFSFMKDLGRLFHPNPLFMSSKILLFALEKRLFQDVSLSFLRHIYACKLFYCTCQNSTVNPVFYKKYFSADFAFPSDFQ